MQIRYNRAQYIMMRVRILDLPDPDPTEISQNFRKFQGFLHYFCPLQDDNL